MINKLWLWITTIVILIVCIAVILINSPKTSINSSALIEDALSKQYDKKNKVNIFNSHKLNNYEIIGFTIAGSDDYGYAVLKQDENSKVELLKIDLHNKMVKRAHDIFIDYIDLFSEESDFGTQPYLVIISMNEELSKIKWTIDGETQPDKEINTSPSLTVLEYPIGSTTAEYIFYDEMGNIIQ
ncbi:hypothetical protein UACE39S_06448 [Ureibacillus acetophenoni]